MIQAGGFETRLYSASLAARSSRMVTHPGSILVPLSWRRMPTTFS